MDAAYRFGIEEEFFLADSAMRGTPQRHATTAFHAAARKRLTRVQSELLQGQIEITTRPCVDSREARDELAEYRNRLAELAGLHGLLLFASGTHPLARWPRQKATESGRYERITRDYGMLAARNMVCAMHVHVEVPNSDNRINLMNRLVPFVPLLLALSTNSPFWQGRRSGLAAYRISAFSELPRTGLPELFNGLADYQRYLGLVTASGALPDASFIWWVLRPSMRYSTIELRVADSCARLADTLAIAALFRCLVRLVDRRPDINLGFDGVSRALAGENMWRAQRDGVRATLIDEKRGVLVPMSNWLDQVLALVANDAETLGCEAEIAATSAILARGTGADQQLEIYGRARRRGVDSTEALRAVVDWLAAETAPEAIALMRQIATI